VRTIPRGLHCFEMAFIDGALLARIGTDHTPMVLMSGDWGKSWTPVVFDTVPECLFVLGDKAHGINWDAGLCTLENGYSTRADRPQAQQAGRADPMYLYFNRLYRLEDPRVFQRHVVGTAGSLSASPMALIRSACCRGRVRGRRRGSLQGPDRGRSVRPW